MERTVVLVEESTHRKPGWREKFIVTHEVVSFSMEMDTDEVLRELSALGLRPAAFCHMTKVLEDMGKKGTRPTFSAVALGEVWNFPIHEVRGPAVSCTIPNAPPTGYQCFSINTRWPKDFVFLAVSHRTEFLDDEASAAV